MNQADLIKKFGNPVDDSKTFEKTWMTMFTPVSRPLHVPSTIYVNKLMVDPLSKIFDQLVSTGLGNEIKTWDGCFNIRKQRNSTSISLHSFGIAIDMNATWEGMVINPTPEQRKTNWTPDFIRVWTDNGFNWGGNFTKRSDPMHFELAL